MATATPRLAAIFFYLLCCFCCSASSSRPLNLISNSSSSGFITHLPGFQGPLPFNLQTGYVEVDESNGVHLFYYFVRSERSAGDDPVVLWLTGGPDAPSSQPLPTRSALSGKEDGSQPNLNLKGYLVGNPVTDFNFDGPSRITFAHGMGFISDEIYEAYEKSCSVGDNRHQSTDECINSLGAIDECIKGICPNHVLEPLCAFASPQPHETPKLKLNSGAREMLQLPLPVYTGEEELHLSEISLQCRTAGYIMSYIWANNASVREALGIHKGTVPSWSRCNYEIPYTNDIPSAVKYHLDVTTKGYRSLIYNGDHDMVIPFIGTQAWIKSLNFSIVDEWRPWFVDGQVAGFTRSYSNNITYATVKGGGHTAPEYMPRQCFAMFMRWVSGDPL